ncbi:MAG: 30S ribosomal protein S17e [archaeon]|nr:30S ribosomal protein S17e [Candidatus Micrarchaeota archaeon]
MGKAVPRGVKTRSASLLKLYPKNFSKDFEENKRFLDSLKFPFSKKTRNLIAGFITKKLNTKEQ